MLKKELVSFVVFADGNESYLPIWLQSIVDQNYPKTETIVVTEKALANLESLQAQYQFTNVITESKSKKIKYQMALSAARGTFISFLLPGTGLVAGTLVPRMEYLTSHPVDLLITRFSLLSGGVFNFYKQNLVTEYVNQNNYYLYLKFKGEFRTLAGKFIRTSLARSLDFEQSDQEVLEQLVLQGATAVWDSDQSFFWNLDINALPEFDKTTVKMPLKVLEITPAKNINEHISSEINLLLCVDDNYCSKIAPLLYSIDQTTSQKVNCYVIYYELGADMLAFMLKLNNLLAKVTLIPTKISTYQHDKLKSFSMNNNKLPLSAYYRLLAAELLPRVKRILYLDVDMLVRSDITMLWREKLGEKVLGACRDLAFTDDKTSWSYQLLDENGCNYFNSGLLLVNLELMRQFNIVKRFIDFIKDTSSFYFLGDQDAFNLFFINNTKLLPEKYNTILSYIDKSNIDEPAIIHYCGFDGLKPWKVAPPVASTKLNMINSYRRINRKVLKRLKEYPIISLILPTLPDDVMHIFRKSESILMQTYPQFEIITAADDKQLDYLKANVGTNIKIKRLNRESSLTELVKAADGDYIFFFDGPHYFKDPDALLKIVEYLLDYRSDLVFVHYLTLVQRGEDYILRGPDESKKFLAINDLSIEDIWNEHVREFANLNGIMISKSLLSTNKEVESNQLSYEYLFKIAHAKYYLDDSLWIEVANVDS